MGFSPPMRLMVMSVTYNVTTVAQRAAHSGERFDTASLG